MSAKLTIAKCETCGWSGLTLPRDGCGDTICPSCGMTAHEVEAVTVPVDTLHCLLMFLDRLHGRVEKTTGTRNSIGHVADYHAEAIRDAMESGK